MFICFTGSLCARFDISTNLRRHLLAYDIFAAKPLELPQHYLIILPTHFIHALIYLPTCVAFLLVSDIFEAKLLELPQHYFIVLSTHFCTRSNISANCAARLLTPDIFEAKLLELPQHIHN
jgi:hypothetical protein